jgi:hypothetical protein
MRILFARLAIVVGFVVAASGAQAAPFTPQFSDYPFPGSQFDVDAAANAFYSTNYGISIENAYLYKDVRDTFDGIGIANGTVAEIGTPQSGRINFLDTTNFVTIDYLAILSTNYSAFTSGGTLLDTFTASPGNGTVTLNGSSNAISYLLFSSSGGFGTVSGLSYNYDGTTDGRNDDLPAVPEPASITLLGLGLVSARLIRRRV